MEMMAIQDHQVEGGWQDLRESLGAQASAEAQEDRYVHSQSVNQTKCIHVAYVRRSRRFHFGIEQVFIDQSFYLL